ncbi:MSF1-domain-containing protein [Auriscalpium vulgare]|uniref:MSF1-domain-containing protein n=1 Tax=Auriscalpium vulgare TaxID=40419 RepID=A0ACB8RUI7_9AGAM|nr:MSF1-domain-containing protein [Auriscalpium vulgare]
MKFFSQSFLYDDPWSIVSLAFFLRYPNAYASHILSCDVISREFSPSGSLLTTRLILKRGALPRWFPQGIMSRAESWVVEESEVDPEGKVVRCRTRNLDHVKVMQVQESQVFRQTDEGQTLQTTEASIVSGFGWGLTKQIENHGLARFKRNVQRSREGVSLILNLIRQARMQPMTMTASYLSPTSASRYTAASPAADRHGNDVDASASEDDLRISRQDSWSPGPA